MTIAMAAVANEDEEREVRRGVVVTRGRAPVVPTRAAETPKQVLMADAARRGPPPPPARVGSAPGKRKKMKRGR